MNKVYLLGAGASRDLKFRISNFDAGYQTYSYNDFDLRGPLSTGYFYYVNQISKQVKSNTGLCVPAKISDGLMQYINNHYDIVQEDLLENELVSHKVNIEDLYLNIEQELVEQAEKDHKVQEELSQQYIHIYFLRKDLLEYIIGSLSFIEYHCFSKYHALFAEHIIKNGGDIISFNWDILMDEAMFYSGKWSYETGYGVDFKSVMYKEASEASPQIKSNNFILKPHGSINWYRKSFPKDSDLYLILPVARILRGGTLGQLRYAEKIGEDLVQSYIVPPGKKRKYFPRIWKKIGEVLENANEIIAVGFSFNNNDCHVREEFQDLEFKTGLEIKIVNPDGKNLIEIYREVFKTNNVYHIANTLAEFINSKEFRVRTP